MLMIALIMVGLYSARNLPIDALPDITNNQVQIITSSPRLATQEVELFITYPIELAVKSIPEIVELRSVSRFGLSLVTVVFEEHTDIYWARNQIMQRLNEAREQIPEGYGSPELAPISTGLGEIFQYTVSAKPGYEEQLDAMDLRSIQDWIIVPQLLGTKGVAEVNTLGGILKEYEVAVDPDRLRSMGVTIAEIFDALSLNNENTGGAYIDKKPYAYFIRSIGMVNSLEDISKIVVKNDNNIPILIRDVAKVQFGSTVRFGATTKDGEGEVVNGMVMMLKGENSAEIVQLVKHKFEQIMETLPEGVQVVPYLDRSKLVGKAIATVRTNLIEGALIVIFILVLLIGNWRAGLIVASVIPLALLFAVTMMRLFGVSGNLMSLGAIDFGLIVDGAVIIVEAIVHRLQTRSGKRTLSAAEMDEQVYLASSNIRQSAAFGEIIILIVYLPILALVGIEGKMFTPMAQTVAFAIFGAFILSLTYVPMMSALLLSKTQDNRKTFSDRIIGFFQKCYDPVLSLALKLKLLVLVFALALFALALYVFSQLGGEFIPTLSEGDIATHIMIPPGSSLSQEIASTTKAEQLLLEHFPEIEQVVSKIGSAEVPTDPMPMEVADMMIIMKDKSEWTSAHSKEEMFEKMEAVLDDLPGVTTEFTQPIQMRFNELMTGVRSDVGIKIFGDDVERLVAYGDQLVEIIEGVKGVQDARAESVSGFPQITVNYNRDKLALYGLNISELNQTVSMGFAGSRAGEVYEKEQKYDLVVRLQEQFRQNIDNVKNLYISLPSGNQIPLSQVADVQLQKGPAQISREDGKRRVIVGFNVRGRDVESVVSEIQEEIAANIELPVGYFMSYAGQFENLQRAKQRLSVAVPIALGLIFVLLFLTFGSIKQSLLIFTAIPLSAIGGVFALWLRSMPFSISAGIGFIALFGVAVLNGIVLIAYFNQLKSEGMTDIVQRIKQGTKVRLRPVIMTASVASLGFLPMALSTSAGAEVQKPLATVVIGGLLSATLLTLIVLPILYYYSERNWGRKLPATSMLWGLLMLSVSLPVSAQEAREIKLEQALELLKTHSPQLKVNELKLQQQRHLSSAAYIPPKTEIGASFGQMNTTQIDHSYNISQSFNPYVKKVNKNLLQHKTSKLEREKQLALQDLEFQVRELFDRYGYLMAKRQLKEDQQEQYQQLSDFVQKQYHLGERSRLDYLRANLQSSDLHQESRQIDGQLPIILLELQRLLGEEVQVKSEEYKQIEWVPLAESQNLNQHPIVQQFLNDMLIAKAQTDLSHAERKPDFSIGYFIQSIQGEMNTGDEIKDFDALPRFQGVQVGMSLPIFGKAYKGLRKANETEALIAKQEAEQAEWTLSMQLDNLAKQYELSIQHLQYLKETALPSARKISNAATQTYEEGEIGFEEYLRSRETEFETQITYLDAIRQHNQLIHQIQYISNY